MSFASGDVPVLAAVEARFESPLSEPAFEATAEALEREVGHILHRQETAYTYPYRTRDSGLAVDYMAPGRGRLLSLTPDLVRIEVGDYQSYGHLRDLVAQVSGALLVAGTVDCFSRIGLRKVEELTLPWAGRDVRDWEGYVAPALLAPTSVIPPSSEGYRYTGRLHYRVEDEHHVLLSYGALPRPMLRMSPARLRLPRRKTPGGVFMLDVDSYLVARVSGDPASFVSVLDVLDGPIEEVLSRCVMDSYRELRSSQPSLFDQPSGIESQTYREEGV